MRAALLVVAVAVAACCVAPAQDSKDKDKDKDKDKEIIARQKATAIANMKKAEFGKPVVVETDTFLIATPLTEEKAKALGAVLEKVVPAARKGVQYEDKDEPWKGKLAIYYLPDGRDFRAFMRGVIQVAPEGVHYALRANDPFIVDPVEVPAKATEADQFAATAAIVASAYLKTKASTAELPEWFIEGFGRVTAMRAEGLKSKRYLAYQAAARPVAGPKGSRIMDLWTESKPANGEVLANSFAEYLAYGPISKDFTKVIYSFRPNENGTAPTVPQALEAAGWKDPAMLDLAWRKWVATGK